MMHSLLSIIHRSVIWRTIDKVSLGRPFLLASVVLGLVTYALLPTSLDRLTAGIIGWDSGGFLLLLLYALLFCSETDGRIERDAERQMTGEWSIFCVTLGGAIFCFAATLIGLSGQKHQPQSLRDAWMGLVVVTLLLTWLVTHTLFAVRYAHEYYERDRHSGKLAEGLDFPGEKQPDYWDFVYFAFVLGMTFQVSDVQINSHKFRRLATAHGMLGFLFNTVILALTVNVAAGLA